MKRCVFFDRDGIVNRSPGAGWVERWEDFELIPEFVGAARLAKERGYGAAIVTNQRCVATGLVSAETLAAIHDNLRKLLSEEHGVELLGIYACTHDRDLCDCRKPKPGLIVKAAEEHGIDLAASWLVGDQGRDVEAGQAAGCRTILVSEGEWDVEPDFTVADMAALQRLFAKVL